MKTMLTIRKAQSEDYDKIWPIIQKVIAGGDTYVFKPDTPKENMKEYWMSPDTSTYVAIMDKINGTYIIKDNQPGLGSHVANASFMVDPEAQGMGIGKAMGEHALAEAKKMGYLAMQFNIVVSINENAIKLWKKMGFKIAGTLPKVFDHQQLGLVDAYVMHRFL